MRVKIGLAALAAFVAASPALSAPVQDPLSATSAVLDLRGLDLSTVEGQQRLAIRMDQVAGVVCGQDLSRIHLALEAQARQCRADVFADIRSRIATATAARGSSGRVQLARN